MIKFSKKRNILRALALNALVVTPVFGGEMTTVRYSKEDLKASDGKQFIQATDLSDVLSSKLKLIVVTVTQRQGGSNTATRDVAASAPQMSKAQWLKRLSTLSVDPETTAARGDENRLRVTLSQQTRKATEVKFKDAFPIMARIKEGLSFNMDMLNPAASVKTNSAVPDIRYGLVESDILPSDHQIPVASLTQMSELDASFSSPAKVVYTIDRVHSAEAQQVFQESLIVTSENQNTSVWTKRPSTSFKVKIDAADQNATVSDQVGSGSLPGARVALTQADGLVSTQFIAGGASSTKTMTTEVKAPLYKEMSLSRKYDYKMKATHTAAMNILGDSSLPQVNVLYAHNDKKVKGEWIVRKNRFEYNVTAEPRQGFGSGSENKLGKVGDKVSVGLNTSF